MARAGLDPNSVLQAAAELADTTGLDNVSLAELAKKLGIRTPSLYNHVNGLPELRKKLAIYGTERLTQALTMAAVGKSEDDAVRSIAAAYIGFVRRHPGLYEALSRGADWKRDEELQRVSKTVVDLVLRVLEPYGLKDEMAIHTVRGFRSLLHGFASLEQQGGFGMAIDSEVSFQLLLDTFLAGIRSLYAAAGNEKDNE
ncbi:TetR/AcrR family transcriptional regulator [Paenibacillus thalictri]|uniref:TetR/AcrR family transcriptional regulator n=2 Tax=Paenibacillus thalictri TaxID=2527873 RepID=A0A4V2J3T8_9BACL|nr:TetR/AcrR family transcriptional regulator [Paenibacillus thalictri]